MKGKFGRFGGQFVPETLMYALEELERSYNTVKKDRNFQHELEWYRKKYAGRPTPLYFAKNLTALSNGARIYLKREDLLHGGAHKINNCLGQALLAKKMSKRRVIAETGAGQHGVASAMACAALGLQLEVYMGTHDISRQKLNVFRMKLLGAKINPVDSGSRTLKDAINEALRDWVTNVETTYYMIGSAVGPHPYPTIVRDFQSIIGIEIKKQIIREEGRLPDYLIACVGGGSNAIGTFYPFIRSKNVSLIGVEAGGEGREKNAASLVYGSEGILHGMLTYILQDEEGQIKETHSVAAGLDYPGVGPEHSYLMESGRAEYVSVKDKEALKAFEILSKTEGILPALESAHAVAYALKLAKTLKKDQCIVVTLSGRGDKDVEMVSRYIGFEL